MKAVLLAAGPGTRLAPLTDTLPKILAPVGGEPLLARQLRYLERSGVTAVALNTHHRAQDVHGFLASFESELTIEVSAEDELLGTAGALRPLSAFLDEPFVVLYGDVITDTSLRNLMGRHEELGGIATIAYYESPDAVGKGVCRFDDSGRLTEFLEKPAVSNGRTCISAGLYAIDPSILSFVGEGCVDFGFDVWPRVVAAGETVHGHRLSSYLRDLGTPAALEAANVDHAEGRIQW